MVNKEEIIILLSAETGLSKAECAKFIDSFVALVSNRLERGEEVKIANFGKFVVKQREDKEIYNPTLKEKKFIPAHRVIEFKTSKALDEKMN